ncbi:uncharacterized protein JCM15063_003835 [Sporobolomyces koalae]|uniref:uncharacterized protein n=1 Tax=Sporobolomyces koalae TaxID=500713 RepID=UPI003174CC2D
MLNDWNTIDIDSALGFLDSCRRYEGGFAQRPHLEANAGPTYCAIAAYHLSGRLPQLEAQDSLLRWLLARQVHPSPPSSPSEPSSSSDDEDQDEHEPSTLLPFESCAGFQGRTNKPLDACYSFWNLAALRLLVPNDLESLIDPTLNTTFLLHCQHPQFGGIAREPKAMPDIMHTYLSLAALSIENSSSNHYNREEEEPCRRLAELDVAWNVEVKVANRFRDKIAALQ